MICTTCGAPIIKYGPKITDLVHDKGHCINWLIAKLEELNEEYKCHRQVLKSMYIV